jgi:hypothetical protein
MGYAEFALLVILNKPILGLVNQPTPPQKNRHPKAAVLNG